MEKDTTILRKRLNELATKAFQQNRYCYTPFLDLYEQSIYQEEYTTFHYVTSHLIGGHPYADRQLVCFGCEEVFGYSEEPPIACIKIEPVSKKFSDDLNHRDFLGAIMNLGIDRSMVGDILISENVGYVFCLEHIADLLTNSLSKVKQTVVICTHITKLPQIEMKYKEIKGSVSSCRLDSIIGLAFQLSRSQAISYIQGKKVFVNGRLIQSNSLLLKESMTISVRGLGKFIFDGVDGISKKGKQRVTIRKFIS